MINTGNDQQVELNIGPDKVCAIIAKARVFDVKVEPVDLEPENRPIDAGNEDLLESSADDPATAELREAIDDLNDDEVVDLIALAWVGRGDFGADDWEEARALAEERHRVHSADYLMGMPALGDYLEEGLETIGHSCEGYGMGRL